MKKLKYLLIVLMLCLVAGGIYIAGRADNEYTKTEFVLDTTCSVTFYGKDAKAAADAVFDEVRRIESLMSMYKEGSDVSRINIAKEGETVKVSKDTYAVLKTALSVCEKSGGGFDITIAPITALWNFGAENPKVPKKEAIENALLSVDYKNIVLCDNLMVIKLKTETKIDLGGAAKGYAGDCARAVAEQYNLKGGIIDLGGNIICFGENPKSDNGKWVVGIQIPFEPSGTYEKTVEIDEGTVVTSGNYQRYFEKNSTIYHHILNPETGYPKDGEYDSVTVIADSSLVADCLSTAAYVLGEDDGTKLVKSYNGKVYFENERK